MKECKHSRGDWIEELGIWLCSDCWTKLEERPKKYGPNPNLVVGSESKAPMQIIVWQAEIAKSDCGMTLNEFLRCMSRRFVIRTRPSMSINDAYEASIEVLKIFPDQFGDPDYDWSKEAAREIVDDELQYWESANGGNK